MRSLLSRRLNYLKPGARGLSLYGVKLVVGPRELLRLPEARGEVPLEALEDFPVPEAAMGI